MVRAPCMVREIEARALASDTTAVVHRVLPATTLGDHHMTLRIKAARALDEWEASLAAAVEHAQQIRRTNATEAASDAVARLTGTAELMVRDVTLTGTNGFETVVIADDLTLHVEQYDDGTINISLLAPCPDCHQIRSYGEWITHLHELGQALRDSERPCGPCQGVAPHGMFHVALETDDEIESWLRSWS